MTPSPSRPSLSITLPNNFQFHYNGDQLPKTPDRQDEAQSAIEPPPPPRQPFKVKRKRAIIPFQDSEQQMSDNAIPTIEMSEAASVMSSPMLRPTSSAIGLLAPLPSFQRLVTPPKTPVARLSTNFDHVESPAQEWGLINDSRARKPAFERSGSVCSSFSDSSVSSCGSSAFSAPYGSCASPESEATDPFMEDELTKRDKPVISPVKLNASPSAKRTKTHRNVKWTQQMDDHLWITYMTYLQDPTLTPFKMLPGTSPPLGVCHRVAAKAKRSWKERRPTVPGPLGAMVSVNSSFQREGSPDTIRPNTEHGSREAKQPQWPRSESATRRRLRDLCKRKPSLSAHYQRLLHTRSPSPFQSSTPVARSSEPPSAAPAFSSTDMKISLVTATNPSMQPDAPIAQLTSDDMRPRPQSQRSSRPTDWFARIGRSSAHQKSLSLQSGLGLEANTFQAMAGTLASPFDEASDRSHLLHSMVGTKSLGRTEFNRQLGKAPSLDSPFEVQGAPTAPRSLKRRFRSDEEKPKRLSVQNIFGPAEDNGIVRNRGFSVGAVRASDNLTKLFTPPTPVAGPAAAPASTPAPAVGQDHEMSEAPELPSISDLGPPGSRSAPRRLAEPTPRLGSPFTETPATSRQFNTFPRSYLPSSNNPQPFQQRLRELAAHHAANHYT